MKELPSKTPRVAKCYKIGDLVTCVQKHNLDTYPVATNIIYPFSGHGVIVELQWPEKAKILTNTGEIMCIPLESIQTIKQAN